MDTGCLHNLTLDNKLSKYQMFTPEDERSFLIEFYHETGGPKNWGKKKGWDDNNTHHCQWFGIQCYPNNTYVKSIDMTGNGVVGTPRKLWRFRNLQGICMSRNIKITGRLSDIVASNMTRLRRLCLSFAGLNGTIPWDVILKLQNLEKLQICCMFAKRLKGNYLPWDLGKLNKLQVFSIGENDIRGELPFSIRELTKLWFLDLEYVKLGSGSLFYFSNMTDLMDLHMTNCGLKGTIPQNFGKNHPKLIELNLYGNNLEGGLSDQSLLGLDSLQYFSLGVNNLNGLLPRSLGSLKSLKVLDLSSNSFNGFQENMTFSPNLETLYLTGNKHMVSDIKWLIAAIQPCKDSLRTLMASKCALTGEIQGQIWNMASLMYLDLSVNNLTGGISLTNGYNLLYLFHVNLASNNFTGELNPMTFFSPLKALTYLNIQNNPQLRSKAEHAFLPYMKPNYRLTLQKSTFSCPSIDLTNTGGIVDMDPSCYDYSLCSCDEGFYGYSNHCIPCMDGGSCVRHATPLTSNVESETEQGNDIKMEISMTIKKGYWPCCDTFDDVQRLVKCDKKEIFEKDVCSPSGDCLCHVKMVDGKPKTSCNSSCVCLQGSTGRFCSKCIDGYYKRGDVCVRCPEFRKNFPVVTTVSFVVCLLVSVLLLSCFRSHKRLSLLAMFVFVVTLTVLHFKSIIPGWFFIIIFAVWILGLSGGRENLQTFLCIAVFFFQSLDAMLSDAKIWPKAIVLLKYKITNVFNFELSQLTCSFSGVSQPEIDYAIVLLLPFGGIICIWLMFIICTAIGCDIKSSTCKRLTIQLLLFAYFPITAKTFSAILPCLHQDKLSYLKTTPWLNCSGTSYEWLKGLGYSSLVGFVIGVPVCVFLPLLLKNLDNDGEPVSQDTDAWLKPLYEEYQSKYRRYFPLVFLGRRLLLAAFLSLVPSTSCYQILGITCVLITFIILTLIARPYEKYSDKFEFENMADIVISVILLLSFVGLAFLRNSSSLDKSLIWLILIINGLVVLCCVCGILVLFVINLLKSPQDGNNVQYQEIPD